MPSCRRDLGEKVHFDEPVKLARGYLVLEAELFQERQVKKMRSGHANPDAIRRESGIYRNVEVDLREGAVGRKPGVVAVVAKVIKGFVGVFHCDFCAGG